MAKRKRLTPVINVPQAASDAPLETKAQNGWVGYGARRDAPPIADVAGSAATSAALDELAHELQTARAEGRMVVRAALDAIDETYLVRDRAALDDEEMEVLKASLRDRGQQTPIEVVELGGDRLGLISGWRRLTALKALHAADPKGNFGHVQCLIKAPEAASDAYIAMVEENEIRAGLSFYERARIAARASEQGAFETPRAAGKALFGSVPRAKRSKIYSFLGIYDAFDGVLKFPQAITEKLGLQMAKALNADTGFAASLKAALQREKPESAEQEVALIADCLAPKDNKSESIPAKPGIQIKRQKDRVVLSGQGVDASFIADLQAWLAAR